MLFVVECSVMYFFKPIHGRALNDQLQETAFCLNDKVKWQIHRGQLPTDLGMAGQYTYFLTPSNLGHILSSTGYPAKCNVHNSLAANDLSTRQ